MPIQGKRLQILRDIILNGKSSSDSSVLQYRSMLVNNIADNVVQTDEQNELAKERFRREKDRESCERELYV
jgi:hypothetical protein